MDLSSERIAFPKEKYTVPEAVKIVAGFYGIRLEDKASTDPVFRAMAQRVRDELHKMEEEEWLETESSDDVKRRRYYPGEWIDKAINERLRLYFPKVEAGQKNSIRKKWERLADEYTERCKDGSYRDEENEYYVKEFSDYSLERAISDNVEYYTTKILKDIVFSYLVELDEGKLRDDLAASLRFAEDYSPTPEDMGAMERLKDLSNYYKWRSKKMEDLFKD